MSERLRSVGLDVGTTTTQLIVSELAVENRASGFAVPDMEIVDRQLVYQSPVYFTPLLDEAHVDGAAIREIVTAEYARAGIRRERVDTGAIIITGETARKENAQAVLSALSDLAGEFVVATAGPDLESVLAAKGSGAVAYSEKTGKTLVHMDIGGGTSNLALIREGVITATGCYNVGGRLLKFGKTGEVTYVSPVLEGLCKLKKGQTATQAQAEAAAEPLVQALEMAAGLREPTALLERLATAGTGAAWTPPPGGAVLSFSGGVADCIGREIPWLEYGDMGPVLGRAIRESRLCQGPFVLGEQTIRATVIGAGCHSVQLSGSTVFVRGLTLPVKNLPVAAVSREEQGEGLASVIRGRLKAMEDGPVVLALPGFASPRYGQVTAMAEEIAAGMAGRPVLVCLEADMAKALGHALCLRLPEGTPCLCIDRLRLAPGSYLDIGQAVGPALRVVIKTLILSR